MDLLLTLRNKNIFDSVKNNIDGIIVGIYFTSGYDYQLNEIEELAYKCKQNNLKFFIEMDNFICETDLDLLNGYFKHIAKLNVNGIFFHDLGIYEIASEYNLVHKLIYDGKSVLCNLLDSYYYLSKGLDSVVISRELTFEEIVNIVKANPNKISLQVLGHTRMSYSKRKFLTNYFNEIGKDYDYFNKKSLYLIEEKRDYKMPIIEDASGTKIYTDYIYEMYSELPGIKNYLRYGIIDSLFIEDELIERVCLDLHTIDTLNAISKKQALLNDYKDRFSSGYLYKKTNITKDEQD